MIDAILEGDDDMYCKDVLNTLKLNNLKYPKQSGDNNKYRPFYGKITGVGKKTRGDDGRKSLSEYVYNEDIGKREEIVAKMIEEKSEDEEQTEEPKKFIVILFSQDQSISKSLSYYNKIIKGFTDEQVGLGTEKWIMLSTLLEHIETDNIKREQLRSTTWNWRFKTFKNITRTYTSNINHIGLMFYKNGGECMVRYNKE